jgi:hypothetical protein
MLASIAQNEIWNHRGIENIPEENILRGLCVVCKSNKVAFNISNTPRFVAKLNTEIEVALALAWKTEELPFPPISRWY